MPQQEEQIVVTDQDAFEWKERCRKALRSMITARVLEEKLAALYKAGKIVGGVYLGKGQEAISGSLTSWMERGRDVFAPLIRDQAGRVGFGEKLLDATQTHLGSALGPMRGRDGNVHRGRPTEGMPAMISHLGAALSVVTGMLLARRLRGKLNGAVGATSIGDGGTSTGAFHEAMNLAAVEKLPLIVMVVNNQFAYSTPNSREFACESLVDRAKGYGMNGYEVQGNDFLACMKTAKTAVQSARKTGEPQMIVANLLRLCGHGEHDDASYIPEEMRQGPLGRDCLEIAKEQSLGEGLIDEKEWKVWHDEARAEATEAAAIAQREPKPDPHTEDWRAWNSSYGQQEKM